MKLQQVSTTPAVVVTCLGHNQKAVVSPTTAPVYADLAGPPFEAYYCAAWLRGRNPVEYLNPWGDVQTIGGTTYLPAGTCAKCGREVFGVLEDDGTMGEPDPRGAAGPEHALYTFEDHPLTPFCWDCPNEHGEDGYRRSRVFVGEGSAPLPRD